MKFWPPRFTLRTVSVWVFVLSIALVMNTTPGVPTLYGSSPGSMDSHDVGWPFRYYRYDNLDGIVLEHGLLAANIAIAIVIAAALSFALGWTLDALRRKNIETR